MQKLTKVGVASLLALGLAGGVTAAYASPDANQAKPVATSADAKQVKPDVKKEQTTVERTHDTAKDRRIDGSGKDTYKESWDHSAKDGSKDGAKDAPSKDGTNDGSSQLDRTKK